MVLDSKKYFENRFKFFKEYAKLQSDKQQIVLTRTINGIIENDVLSEREKRVELILFLPNVINAFKVIKEKRGLTWKEKVQYTKLKGLLFIMKRSIKKQFKKDKIKKQLKKG